MVQTETLDPIGGDPANNIAVRPLNSIPTVPAGGYLGTLAKSSPVASLKRALSERLDIPDQLLSLAYAGRDLEDSLTLRDNGIVEPGAAARRSGARIELVFALPADVVPGPARRAREAAALEATTQARRREEAASAEHGREQAERTRAVEVAEARRAAEAREAARELVAMPAGAPVPVPVDAVAPLPAAIDAEVPVRPPPAPLAGEPPAAVPAADIEVAPGAGPPDGAAAPERCVLRCLPIGEHHAAAEGEGAALIVETQLSAAVTAVARQLHRLLGVAGGDPVILVFNGHMLAGHQILREVGIGDGAELHFYFALPDDGDGEDAAPEAPVPEVPAGGGVEARGRAAAAVAVAAFAEPAAAVAVAAEVAPASHVAAEIAVPVAAGDAAIHESGAEVAACETQPEVRPADEFLREFAQTSGWPIPPTDEEQAEIQQLSDAQLRALQHVRSLCQKQHMAALPNTIERAEKLGFSEFDFVRTLEWVREQAPLIIHLDLSKVGARLSQDTQYRNQFETKRSGGRLDNDFRSTVERELFGGAYDEAKGCERVKYGVLNFSNAGKGVESCRQYGEDYLVLRGVRLRTTLSSADTFKTFKTQTLATPDYYAHIFDGYSDYEFVAALRLGCRRAISEEGGGYAGHYKELQVHGDLRLDQHVMRIVVHPKHRSEGQAFLDTLARLQQACGNCPVLWMDNEADMDEARAFPKSLRELSYEEQGYTPASSSSSHRGPATTRQPDKTMLAILQRLQDAVQSSPAAKSYESAVAKESAGDHMTDAEIVALLKRYVPDLDSRVAPRSQDTPVQKFICSTYRSGLPNYSEAVRLHLGACLRFVIRMIREGEQGGSMRPSRIRSICGRLVDSFEACQAAQARVIEALATELIDGPPFEREVHAMAIEYREQTLDRMVIHLHSEATRTDVVPEKQLAHLANQYRRLLGLTTIDHMAADRHAKDGVEDAVTNRVLHCREEVVALFGQLLDPAHLVESFLADVNQPGTAMERRIDRDGLSRWAGENAAIGHRIYYDASQAELYDGRPAKEDETQPFLHLRLACEILCAVLDCA